MKISKILAGLSAFVLATTGSVCVSAHSIKKGTEFPEISEPVAIEAPEVINPEFPAQPEKPVKAEKPVKEEIVKPEKDKTEKPVKVEKPVKEEVVKPEEPEMPVEEEIVKPEKAEKPVKEEVVKPEKDKTEKPVEDEDAEEAEDIEEDETEKAEKPVKPEKAEKVEKVANVVHCHKISDLVELSVNQFSEILSKYSTETIISTAEAILPEIKKMDSETIKELALEVLADGKIDSSDLTTVAVYIAKANIAATKTAEV